jgi:signal transduction histidine kinase
MRDLWSSVHTRVLLFTTVVCLALLGLDLNQIWAAHDARLEVAKTETDNLARSLAQHVQDIFQASDAALRGVADVLAAEGRDPISIRRLERRMRVRVESQQLFHGLFVFDENGKSVASSFTPADAPEVRDLNVAEREFFRFHRDHGDDVPLIGPPILATTDGVWVVTLSRRLNYPDGRFAGVVEASISIDLLQRFLETFDVGRHGSIALVTGGGVTLVRAPFDRVNVGRDISQAESFRAAQHFTVSGHLEFTGLLDGKPRIGGFHRVPGFDLILMVALDKGDVLEGWRDRTKVHLVWLALTMMLVITLGYRLTDQIRDRVAAEAIAHKLKLEAEQFRVLEAERRVHQRELEEQHRELERSNADLEEFAYAASHDLQAPLRAIGNLAQWIDDDVRAEASAETLENLGLLRGRVVRLQTLIRGLLAYARMGRTMVEAEDLDVAAVVRDVVNILEPRPNFVIACEGEMFAIRTYRAPFELVMKNLIGNALQHHDRAEGRVSVSMRLIGDMAEIRVSDDGPGIDEQFHEKIFVVFATINSRDDSESSGIGLAMVKKAVMNNGGRIWVESAPPVRGTTFVFTWKLEHFESESKRSSLFSRAI